VPNTYWQGVTTAPGKPFFFDGVFEGLHRTTRGFRQTGSVASAIPVTVKAAEGYNHIGDISYDRAEGGRVLLPLECFTPGGPNGGNTCGTGSIGSADPRTLGFRYYVKLDPSEIAKAMWVETSPDGELLWTSSGPDLLAYRAADVTAANAAPAAPPIHSVRRLAGAVPPSGVTGAAFWRGRLLLAGARGTTYQVWSVNVTTGARRLELELKNVQGEAEGLTQIPLAGGMGGRLHFLVAPLAASPTFGPTVGLLHFVTGDWTNRGLKVRARATRARTNRPRVTVTVRRRGKPVEDAVVHVAGARGVTGENGKATVRPRRAVAGTFAALARSGSHRGRSNLVRIGPSISTGAARSVPAR
jgi:hypothetical protein